MLINSPSEAGGGPSGQAHHWLRVHKDPRTHIGPTMAIHKSLMLSGVT